VYRAGLRDCGHFTISSQWPVDLYHIWSKERVELRDCGHFTISSQRPVDHYHIRSKERVELLVSRDLLTITVYGAGAAGVT